MKERQTAVLLYPHNLSVWLPWFPSCSGEISMTVLCISLSETYYVNIHMGLRPHTPTIINKSCRRTACSTATDLCQT